MRLRAVHSGYGKQFLKVANCGTTGETALTRGRATTTRCLLLATLALAEAAPAFAVPVCFTLNFSSPGNNANSTTIHIIPGASGLAARETAVVAT